MAPHRPPKGSIPRFIPVKHGLAAQRLLEFLTRDRDRGARFFPRGLRAPQTDRDLQRAFEEPLDDQARQPTHDRQIRNQGRELRPELPLNLVRQRRLRRLSARATAQPMAAILGDVRFDHLAEAMGGFGIRVTKPEDIRPALEKARDSGKPALVDVVINREVYSSGTSNQTMYK